MIYALTAFSLACLAMGIWSAIDWHRIKQERDAYDREAQEWAKLYWDLRDDTPARGSDGRFTRRGR